MSTTTYKSEQRKSTKSSAGQVGAMQHQDHNPQQQQQPLPCPRCNSSNTKFCYYNNYNLSQPRHFCKACRRYWTKGGTLRDIPVGGGTRKTAKRCRTSSPAATTTSSSSITTNNTATAVARTHDHFHYGGGSFTSLMNSTGVMGGGILGFGIEDHVGFGLGRAVWQFPSGTHVGEGGNVGNIGNAGGNIWQYDINGDGFGNGFVPGIYMK